MGDKFIDADTIYMHIFPVAYSDVIARLNLESIPYRHINPYEPFKVVNPRNLTPSEKQELSFRNAFLTANKEISNERRKEASKYIQETVDEIDGSPHKYIGINDDELIDGAIYTGLEYNNNVRDYNSQYNIALLSKLNRPYLFINVLEFDELFIDQMRPLFGFTKQYYSGLELTNINNKPSKWIVKAMEYEYDIAIERNNYTRLEDYRFKFKSYHNNALLNKQLRIFGYIMRITCDSIARGRLYDINTIQGGVYDKAPGSKVGHITCINKTIVREHFNSMEEVRQILYEMLIKGHNNFVGDRVLKMYNVVENQLDRIQRHAEYWIEKYIPHKSHILIWIMLTCRNILYNNNFTF